MGKFYITTSHVWIQDIFVIHFYVVLHCNFRIIIYCFIIQFLILKNASVDLDILIITPVECMCITVLEDEDVAAFIGSGDRFWVKKVGETETKLLNPLIGLDRMEKIVIKYI